MNSEWRLTSIERMSYYIFTTHALGLNLVFFQGMSLPVWVMFRPHFSGSKFRCVSLAQSERWLQPEDGADSCILLWLNALFVYFRAMYTDWLKDYEQLTDMVVPRSSKLVVTLQGCCMKLYSYDLHFISYPIETTGYFIMFVLHKSYIGE